MLHWGHAILSDRIAAVARKTSPMRRVMITRIVSGGNFKFVGALVRVVMLSGGQLFCVDVDDAIASISHIDNMTLQHW